MHIFMKLCLLYTVFVLVMCRSRNYFVMNENWVCNVKRLCIDCLRLSQCSWCKTENKCFSRKLTPEDYCRDNFIDYHDHGLSLLDNAKCSCAGDIEENCTPPDIFTDQKCSGRGSCLCGRCVCDQPDPEHPTKMVVGDYCEYDNFSCDGPKCNEGPYHYLQNDTTLSIDSVFASLFSNE
ncbi:hypothetical protein ACJJTC_001392 [Scirpophaga incertulas]